jgi:RimJ/RimL family protein N-acetyltransferase
MTMLRGNNILLRTMREADLDAAFEALADIGNRGDYFPAKIPSEPAFKKSYHDGKFWSEEGGFLLIQNPAAAVIGHIEFYKPVSYLDSFELSYLLYDTAERGKGIVTEAVRLLTAYLFDTRKLNRLQLIIHPGNAASRRVAEKNGFAHEGTMRGAWYHRGCYHDVEVYALLREQRDRLAH